MKKGLKITLIVILSLIVVAGATLGIAYATNGDYVKNAFAMMTKDDDEYFKWVTQKNVDKSLENTKAMFLASKSSASTGTTMSSDVSVELSDELFEMIASMNSADSSVALPTSIKPFGFSTVLATEGDTFGSSYSVKYNGVDLISIASLIKLDAKELFVSFPSYKSDAIDFSSLARTNISKYFDVAKINEALKSMGADITVSESDVQDIFTIISKFGEFASNSYSDMQDQEKLESNIETFTNEFNKVLNEVQGAVLEKNVEVTVNGVSTECNTITVKLSKNDILKIVTNFFNEKESDLRSMLTNELNLSAEDVEKAVSEIKNALDQVKNSQDVSFGVDLELYVNSHGEYIGATVKVGVSTYKITLKFLKNSEDENNSTTGLEISVAGMKILKGTITETVSGSEKKKAIALTVGDIIKSFAPQFENYGIKIESIVDDGNTRALKNSIEFMIVNGSSKLASIKAESLVNSEEAVMPIKIDSVNKIAYDQLLDTDYFTIKDLALYLVNKVEAINDEYIDSMVKSAVEKILGTVNSIADLKQKIEEADFSVFDTQIKSSIKNSINSGVNSLGELSQSFNFTDSGFEPVSEPVVDDSLKIDPDEMHSYSKSEYAAYITGFEYSNIDLSGQLSTVDYVELENCKVEFLAQGVTTKVLSNDANRTIQSGDKILFDAVPLVGGFAVTMYEYKEVPAYVGEYQYGAGIDDQFIGHKVGDTLVLNITLGSEFGDFAGYNGDFRITVSGIYDIVQPEWTESYICGVLGYESLEACEQKLITENGLDDVTIDDSMIFNAIVENIYENYMDHEAFEALYSKKRDEYIAEMDVELAESGISDKTYLEYLYEMGMTEEETEIVLREMFDDSLKLEIITSYMAEKENVQASYREVVEGRGENIEDITQPMYEAEIAEAGEAALYDQVIWSKAGRLLLDRVKEYMQ